MPDSVARVWLVETKNQRKARLRAEREAAWEAEQAKLREKEEDLNLARAKLSLAIGVNGVDALDEYLEQWFANRSK